MSAPLLSAAQHDLAVIAVVGVWLLAGIVALVIAAVRKVRR